MEWRFLTVRRGSAHKLAAQLLVPCEDENLVSGVPPNKGEPRERERADCFVFVALGYVGSSDSLLTPLPVQCMYVINNHTTREERVYHTTALFKVSVVLA